MSSSERCSICPGVLIVQGTSLGRERERESRSQVSECGEELIMFLSECVLLSVLSCCCLLFFPMSDPRYMLPLL
jgi:hypothetical protein